MTRLPMLCLAGLLSAAPCYAADPAADSAAAPAGKTSGASTPLDAMRRFVLVWNGGDEKATRAMLWTENDLQAAAADVWASSTTGQFRLRQLVFERFGPEGLKEYDGGTRQPPMNDADREKMADAVVKEVRVTVDGDKAVVSHPARQDAEHPELRRTPDGWKIVFETMEKRPAPRTPAQLRQYIKMNRLWGRAYHKTADEVKEGKYQTVAEVQRVLSERTEDKEETNRQLDELRQLREKARQRGDK
jgi:hypothetical protein